jgi:hypothetical protein
MIQIVMRKIDRSAVRERPAPVELKNAQVILDISREMETENTIHSTEKRKEC